VAPAFVPSGIGLRGETVVLGEGESVDAIDFELIRGGVITGKVVDANGRPVVEQHVGLVSADRTPRQPVVIQTSNAMTDDRGIYRMFGLTPGSYKVFVGQSDDNFFNTVASGRASYKQTFHPNVTEESEAAVVEVNEGTEATNIDIALGQATQTFAATGILIDGDSGKPVPNVRFGVQLMAESNGGSYIGTNVTSNAKGAFRIENLIPGKYGIFVAPQRDSEVRAEGVIVEIVDQDVEGLVIKTIKGASITGRVILETTTDQTAWPKLTQLFLQVFVHSTSPGTGFVQTSSISPDGSFRTGGLQEGIATVSLGATDRRLLKGFSVARIEKDQVVQPRGVQVKAGEQITGLLVVVSYGTATVRGTVKPVSGTIPPGVRISLRVSKTGDNSKGLQPTIVDSRGYFVIEALAAGTYDFFVTAAGPGMVRAATAKQQIEVLDGVTQDVTITIDLNAKPAPSQ
jgi:uncharacterized GH25 family protein